MLRRLAVFIVKVLEGLGASPDNLDFENDEIVELYCLLAVVVATCKLPLNHPASGYVAHKVGLDLLATYYHDRDMDFLREKLSDYDEDIPTAWLDCF